MRKTNIALFCTAVLTSLVLHSCSKDSGSSSPSINQATVDGAILDFSKSIYGVNNGKTLNFTGKSDTSLSANKIYLTLASSNLLKVGAYSSDSSTSLSVFARISGVNYFSRNADKSNTITITSLDSMSFAGSYFAKVYANDSTTTFKTITGLFKR